MTDATVSGSSVRFFVSLVGIWQAINDSIEGPFGRRKKLANNQKKLANFGFGGVPGEKRWPTTISKLAIFQFIEEIQG